jgi:hypothetical protein
MLPSRKQKPQWKEQTTDSNINIMKIAERQNQSINQNARPAMSKT